MIAAKPKQDLDNGIRPTSSRLTSGLPLYASRLPRSVSPQVTIEIAELQNKTVNQLVQRYEQVFNEQCRSRNKPYLIRCIAWRLQANAEGGLSRAALKKAEELAVDAETRVTAPRKHSTDGVKLVVTPPAYSLLLAAPFTHGSPQKKDSISSSIRSTPSVKRLADTRRRLMDQRIYLAMYTIAMRHAV